MKFILLTFLLSSNLFAKSAITIGSKNFTESYILAEILAQKIEKKFDIKVIRKFGMAGTGINVSALEKNEIDFYPEYTGTIARFILKNKNLTTTKDINKALEEKNLAITESLGFNNTYALAVLKNSRLAVGVDNISDLAQIKKLRGGFSHEFIKREDGLNGLKEVYALKLDGAKGFEHSLSYDAIKQNLVDIIEVYSTDGKIEQYNLKVLEDDKEYFPEYQSVIFYHKNFSKRYPEVFEELKTIEGSIDEKVMRELNARVDLEGYTFAQVARSFLEGKEKEVQTKFSYFDPILWKLAKEHINLVMLSLLFSVLVGIPLGLISYRSRKLGQVILLITGVFQTIPSLALLCFLLPLFGIGIIPSLIALFLYGLLPIVRNTLTGFQSITVAQQESAKVLGLTRLQKLRKIELPLASKNIMTGIKTSGVIGVGMATLAAFIGAGGFGSLIVTGLALNSVPMILKGAIPSAVLSIFVHLFFELLEKAVVPRGLK